MEEEKEEKRKKTRHNIRREATRTMRAESVAEGGWEELQTWLQ
jgi:hypothetical protein